MGLFDFIRRGSLEAQSRPGPEQVEPAAPPARAARAEEASGHLFTGLDDPLLLDLMRGGGVAGSNDSAAAAKLRNMAVLRCVSLISESMGMLPLNLIEKGPAKRYATEHPVYRLLKVEPNTWQTPYEFKSGMQANALIHGDAYARVIWSLGRPIRLVPMEYSRVEAKLSDDWQMQYVYSRKDGGQVILGAHEVLHLRDLSLDGINGMSRVRLARDALGLAAQAQRAAARVFKSGVMASGAIEVPTELSEAAYRRMKESIAERHSGADNAGSWMVLEENAKANKWANTAVEGQQMENRNHQIEEVGRAFGVPRALMMMDDTSWGTGMEQLGIFFIQYGLQHWFTAWEEAIKRVLLSVDERDRYHVKFNERALLRGTLKDQGDYLAKASGAGGHAPWMSQNEVREVLDLPESDSPGTNDVRPPSSQKEKPNEPPKPA